jgi:hypothetical protein
MDNDYADNDDIKGGHCVSENKNLNCLEKWIYTGCNA